MSSLTSKLALQVGLVAAAIAAFFVVLNLLSTGFRIFCLIVIVAAAAVSFPYGRGQTWWWFLVGGAAASVLGAIVAQPSTTLGGWLALLGGLAVIVGAIVGFPRERGEESQ
jgi:hypothetical protein